MSPPDQNHLPQTTTTTTASLPSRNPMLPRLADLARQQLRSQTQMTAAMVELHTGLTFLPPYGVNTHKTSIIIIITAAANRTHVVNVPVAQGRAKRAALLRRLSPHSRLHWTLTKTMTTLIRQDSPSKRTPTSVDRGNIKSFSAY